MTKRSATARQNSQKLSVRKDARISPCGRYRYWLTRVWGDEANLLVWLMLNPSVGSAERDDHTIRKCIGFARIYGYEAIGIVNLFSIRETHPKNLVGLPEASLVGPEDELWLRQWLPRSTVVCAWGQHSFLRRQIKRRIATIKYLLPRSIWCLGRCSDGSPKHPLRPGYENTELEAWNG
jgi:hypothetical protein